MRQVSSSFLFPALLLTLGGILLTGVFVSPVRSQTAADKPPLWSGQEKLIAQQLQGLRKLPDDVRGRTTKDLALQIRQLPVTANKLRLASGLSNMSTEGDFGHDTLQEVATTLAEALREWPPAAQFGCMCRSTNSSAAA